MPSCLRNVSIRQKSTVERMEDELHYFARKKQVSVDLKTLMDTGMGKALQKMKKRSMKGTDAQLVSGNCHLLGWLEPVALFCCCPQL